MSVIELIGFHSPDIDNMNETRLRESITNENSPDAALIGLRLAVLSNEKSRTVGQEFMELLSSRIQYLGMNLRFLEGLETFASRLSLYPIPLGYL